VPDFIIPEEDLPYNHQNIGDIVKYAEKLEGQTLKQACPNFVTNQFSGKGGFGQSLEYFYFFYQPNNNPEPDFEDVGLELKASPLKQLKKDGKFTAKERIVLNIIDYNSIISETFNKSEVLRKNNHLLVVFYFHKQKGRIENHPIKLVGEWKIPERDLKVIKDDWLIIQKKVKDGLAHELSESNTLYLGACTKGSGASTTRAQPNSTKLAKQRAFSLKTPYVRHIIGVLGKRQIEEYGQIITSLTDNRNLEQIIFDIYNPLIGLGFNQLKTQYDLQSNAKNKLAILVKKILINNEKDKIEEFEKAGIRIKTVNLEPNGNLKESLSFPCFKYTEIIKEKWEESNFKEYLDGIFFFAFFQKTEDGSDTILKKILLWRMPQKDIKEAKKVWVKTKELVKDGLIVKGFKSNGNRITHFPNSKENRVSHVRPHAKNADDTYPLPITDKLTGLNNYTKHCFWLNSKYLKTIYKEG